MCCCCVDLKSILRVGLRVKDSIEDSFKLENWLGGVRVRLHVRVQGTTTASKVCECYYFVTSLVFLIMDIPGLAAPEWFFS
jgi:hypothetical protein